MKNVLSCEQYTKESLEKVMVLAEKIKNNPKAFARVLEGKIVAVMFFEPSTRTRMSFESAIQRLGAKMIVTENAMTNSSTTKGESLEDTIRVLEGYSDAIVMRHRINDAAERAAKIARVPIINAGSGSGEHPTQALLDMFTIREKHRSIDGIKIAVLGDLKYGRTIHSLIKLLSLYKNVTIYGLSKKEFELPEEYIKFLEEKGTKYIVCNSFDDIPLDIQVLYHTRIQSERFEGDFGKEKFILNKEVLDKFSKDTIVLHPLPRVDEISTDIDDDARAMFFKQAHNGVWIRMALLIQAFGIE